MTRCVIGAGRGLILSIAAAVWMCPAASWAQSFPTKPVRYVVPFGPGTSPDIVGRLLADRLTRLWGQQVIVENRVGVAGVLGTAFVAKSPPDVLRVPDMHQRLEELVMGGPPTTRDEFDQFIRAEIARWAKVIADAGIPQQ